MKTRNDETARRLLAEEVAQLESTELVEACLQGRGITRTMLADRLGVTKSEISQRLSGKRNLTVKTLAAMMHELGYRVRLECDDLASAQVARFVPISGNTSGGLVPQRPHYTQTGSTLRLISSDSPAA